MIAETNIQSITLFKNTGLQINYAFQLVHTRIAHQTVESQ